MSKFSSKKVKILSIVYLKLKKSLCLLLAAVLFMGAAAPLRSYAASQSATTGWESPYTQTIYPTSLDVYELSQGGTVTYNLKETHSEIATSNVNAAYQFRLSTSTSGGFQMGSLYPNNVSGGSSPEKQKFTFSGTSAITGSTTTSYNAEVFMVAQYDVPFTYYFRFSNPLVNSNTNYFQKVIARCDSTASVGTKSGAVSYSYPQLSDTAVYVGNFAQEFQSGSEASKMTKNLTGAIEVPVNSISSSQVRIQGVYHYSVYYAFDSMPDSSTLLNTLTTTFSLKTSNVSIDNESGWTISDSWQISKLNQLIDIVTQIGSSVTAADSSSISGQTDTISSGISDYKNLEVDLLSGANTNIQKINDIDLTKINSYPESISFWGSMINSVATQASAFWSIVVIGFVFVFVMFILRIVR